MPLNERSLRTPALILKRRNFGEADRLLTVLTPRHGKFDVIAKGARKPTSTKTGHVELFTCADMLIHRGRDLDIATQAVMTHTFLALREDLQRGAYASYVVELLDHFTVDEDADLGGLFDLLMHTLQGLCDDPDPRRLTRYYELRLLDAVGFRPELNECVFTHEAIQAQDQYFSYSEGGVVSPQAMHLSTAHVPIALPTLKLLRYMQRSPYSHLQDLSISPALHANAERLMLGYLTYLLERRLQSVDFIRRIRN